MKSASLATLAILLGTLAGCISGGPYPELETAASVDVDRYMGKWYEIARYPNWFQGADCVGTTADYALRDDGRVTVFNRCLQGGFDGPEDTIEGTARIVDTDTNAKLKVRFFGPFEGDYWIIDLDEDYQWAVVGEPSRRFLWILSRTPTMDEETYDAIIARLPDQSYDPAELVRTPQEGE